jgi:hypothetical protein
MVGELLANAYLAELSALEYKSINSRDEFEAAYSKACDLFLKAGRILKAAECLEAMGNTVAAAGEYIRYILLSWDQKLNNPRRYLIQIWQTRRSRLAVHESRGTREGNTGVL